MRKTKGMDHLVNSRPMRHTAFAQAQFLNSAILNLSLIKNDKKNVWFHLHSVTDSA